VKIQEVEEETLGILLPTTAQTKPQGGTVVAVGSGRTMGDKKIAVDIEVWFGLQGTLSTGLV